MKKKQSSRSFRCSDFQREDLLVGSTEATFDPDNTHVSKNCLAFRGYKENIDDTYNGNFLSTVKLLAEFDPIMHELLRRPRGTMNYLSPTIQNEVIEILGNALEAELVDGIKRALFYSLITDTTQDVSKIDQLSQTFRYVEIIKDE